ncbi:MAG TPA: signal peptidase II [Ignavibacteriaceae bacterium]|nr:signal peptidase II [Ignavibacteriaceae bacterium]
MRVLIVSVIIVIIDQATKLFVKGFSIPFLHFKYAGMYEGERIPVIGNFFRITFIENPGMAFGFDPGINFKLWISVFSLAASIGLIIYLYFVRNQRLSLRIALAFILGGAVGNLIDRMFYGIFYGYASIFYGRVVDFLDVDFFDFSIFGRSYDRWPIFNVADAAVTIGVLILIIFYKKNSEQNEIPEPVGSGLDEFPVDDTHSNGTEEEQNDSIKESSEENKKEDGETDHGKEIPL